MNEKFNFLDEEISNLKAENRLIKLHILESEQAPVATIDGKKVVNLTSNNYLSLTTHPKVKKAAIEAVEKYGIGTAAVRTIIGTMTMHEELERRLAAFKGTEASLLTQSGFTANTATCQCLMTSPEDVLISDELNHASIIDGGRLAKAKKKVYRHSDMAHLKEILESDDNEVYYKDCVRTFVEIGLKQRQLDIIKKVRETSDMEERRKLTKELNDITLKLKR